MYSGNDGHQSRVRYQWIVPRRIMCALFWAGVLLIFIGMILLVTSQHKGQMFQSWGAVLLGLGLCILLACVILCIHTYFVMSRRNRQPIDNIDTGSKFNAYQSNTNATMLPGDQPDGFYPGHSSVLMTPPRLARPPRYGISVVTTPPQTVHLYVSDVIDENGNPDRSDDDNPKIIVEPPDHRVPNHVVNTGFQNDADHVSGEGDTMRRKSSTQPSRKPSFANSDNASKTASATTPGGTDTANTWLMQQKMTSKTIPLPFPPANITFDALNVDVCDVGDVTANDGVGDGLSSCDDDSFSQSTETIIARDHDRSSAAINRRKSVYYNNNASEQTGNAGKHTSPGDPPSPVASATAMTLPRYAGSRLLSTDYPTSVNRASAAVKVEPVSKNDRRLAGSGSKVKDRNNPSRGNDDRRSSSTVALTKIGAPEASTSNSAKCRVIRINLHSDSFPEAAAEQRPLSSSTNTHIWPSHKTATDFDSQSPPPATTSTLPSYARGFRFHTGGGRAEMRDTTVDTSGTSAAMTALDRRVGGAIPTTARTCGSACVTVTPLGPRVVAAVDPCPRFPAAATTRTDGRRSRDRDNEDDSMRSLDAVDLLRAEYEASFGGQVNPLLLYSEGLAGEEVSLSKSTVYDNIQYFKV